MYKKKSIAGIVLFIALALAGCNKWKDHTAVEQQDLTKNLLETITANPNLSKFTEYVHTAGLDSLLQATKTFTVWAPTNTALQAIDPAIPADVNKLRAFVLNHISNQLYFIRDVQAAVNIQMLSGKYNLFNTIKFGEAALGATDRYVNNGVLHIINGIVPPVQNIWEFINSTTAQYAQNAYIASLNYNGFDPVTAIIDSISVNTGLPIYRPGTGVVARNYFNERVYDMKREDRQYTYFVMQDANFVVEADSLKKYYPTVSAAISTDSLAKWNVVKDLAYEVAYQNPLAIPATLLSRSGITVPFNTTFVVDVKKLSNGYVYIMSKMDVPTVNKFIPIILQGESPSGFLSDKTGNTNYRIRRNPVTGINFSDIMVTGHGVTTYYSFYRVNESPSIKYQVYASAANDFQGTAGFNQTINAWHTGLAAVQGTLTHAVPLFSAAGAYNEVNLGTITISKFGTVDWRLTAVTTGPIVLDYLRLVPLP
ncbi:fasciclin domain-containing protein [Ferruginibacter sp.]|nr:fasciclin domain-containing protein [Ferruginibacter sp.]